VYVANLPFDVTDAEVKEAFESQGITVVAVRVPRDRGNCKGFGFVNLDGAEAVSKAVSALDGTPVRNRPMVVKPVRPRGAPPESAGANHSPRSEPPSAGWPDSSRRPSPSFPVEPPLNSEWNELGDRRRAQKPKKKEKETKSRAAGRPRHRDKTRDGADWSRRYDRWDDD
jgi:RNA recognition motif-containing protein